MREIKRLYPLLKEEKKTLILIFIFSLIFLISQLLQPFLIGRGINCALESNYSQFLFILILCFALSLVGAISDFIFEYSVNLMTQKIIYKLRNEVFRKYNSVPIACLYKRSEGDLLQLEIGDIENIANGLFAVFKSLIEGALSLVLTLVMMFVVNWILALAVIALSPLSLFVSRFVAKFSSSHFKKQSALQASLSSISLEAIENVDQLQSLNYQEESYAQFDEKGEELKKEGKVAQFSASWTNPVTRLVNNTIYAIIGIAGIIMIPLSASYPILNMTIGSLSSFLGYTNQFSKPFNEISSVVSEYETAVSSLKRLNEFLDEIDDVDEGKKTIEGIEKISFENMSFSYTPDKELIKDFNQEIKRGDKVAIVGPTGAGKTTLINVIMRFYDPTFGCVKIDGIDYLSISKKSLRENFGMVLQETWIFSGTILENVRYAKPDASDEEVIRACKRAMADSFINTLPDGYNTKVKNKGSLSEGERQMITIARVMLLQPDIVILDEATSNVDTRTEKMITKAFDELCFGKTSIVIAHRLSTIVNADLILVLKDGHIVESGTHQKLLKQDGFYASMYKSQFR